MSVYQTSRGWSVDYRDEFNRRRRVHLGTEAAARAFDARIRSHVAAVKNAARFSVQLPNLSPGEAINLFTESLAATTATKKKSILRLSRFCHYLAGIRVRDVTPQLLAAYTERRRAECAPATLRAELYTIRQMFRFLATHWYIHADPSTELAPGRIPKTYTAITLTLAQQRLALAACPTAKTRLRLLLALDAGLRHSEILALRANHISGLWPQLAPARLVVPLPGGAFWPPTPQIHAQALDTALPGGPSLTVWSSKTHTSRTIPLTERLQLHLEARIRPGAHPDTPIIGVGARPQKYTAQFLLSVCEQAGVKFRLHDLRHTFASRLAACGAPLHVIRALLGHRPANTTDLYVHASEEEKREWVDKMEDADL